MSDTLAKFWLFATHWTRLDTFDNEDELNDELELLQRQSLPTKVRTMIAKDILSRSLMVAVETDVRFPRLWLLK